MCSLRVRFFIYSKVLKSCLNFFIGPNFLFCFKICWLLCHNIGLYPVEMDSNKQIMFAIRVWGENSCFLFGQAKYLAQELSDELTCCNESY